MIYGLQILRSIPDIEPVAGCIYVGELSFKMHKLILLKNMQRFLK